MTDEQKTFLDHLLRMKKLSNELAEIANSGIRITPSVKEKIVEIKTAMEKEYNDAVKRLNS